MDLKNRFLVVVLILSLVFACGIMIGTISVRADLNRLDSWANKELIGKNVPVESEQPNSDLDLTFMIDGVRAYGGVWKDPSFDMNGVLLIKPVCPLAYAKLLSMRAVEYACIGGESQTIYGIHATFQGIYASTWITNIEVVP